MTHLVLLGEGSNTTSSSLSDPVRKILFQHTGVYVEVRRFFSIAVSETIKLVSVTILSKTFLNIW